MHLPRTVLLHPGIGLLLIFGVAGCSDSAPGAGDTATEEGTSVAQLCGALTDFRADLATADSTDLTSYVAQLKAAATRLDAVGVPDAMPADAQAGFARQVDLISSLPATAAQEDLVAVGEAAEDPALKTYLATACPDL